MRSPLAAWRGGVRWPLLLLGILAALIVAIAVCEAIGWPFLVSPVQNWLSSTLDRKVTFGDTDDKGVRIGLIGSVRVTAASIEIGSPTWSKQPHMLLAKDAHLKLGYLDLWRAYRGQPLHIDTLEAASARRRLRASRRRSCLVAVRRQEEDRRDRQALGVADLRHAPRRRRARGVRRCRAAGRHRCPVRAQRRQWPWCRGHCRAIGRCIGRVVGHSGRFVVQRRAGHHGACRSAGGLRVVGGRTSGTERRARAGSVSTRSASTASFRC